MRDGSTTFHLSGRLGTARAEGLLNNLPAGALDSLPARAAAFFAEIQDGPAVLCGALPFDRNAQDFLYQPERFQLSETTERQALRHMPSGFPTIRALEADPPAETFARSVSSALKLLSDAGDPLTKVVLSRSLKLRTAAPLDAHAILRRLAADPSSTAFLSPLGSGRQLVGATPELLASKRGARIASHPLAGSARRQPDPGLDRQAGERLLASEKDRREHLAVSSTVLDTLSPLCRKLSAPQGMTLYSTASMWHLGTRIEGVLKDPETPVAELVALLHPTPAVCGLPRARAADAIAALEDYPRGFYAGTVGWMDAQGDGDWHVAIRCAELNGAEARLYAGAGIVAGSDPAAETDETSAKFQAMLVAFGIDETGRALGENAA